MNHTNTSGKSILDKVMEREAEQELEAFAPAKAVYELLAILSPREDDILRRRFGIGARERETLEAIGALYKITRERIRQIVQGSREKLRKSRAYPHLIGPIEELVRRTLEEGGGISSEDELFGRVLSYSDEGKEGSSALAFIIGALSTKFRPILESTYVRRAWALRYSSLALLEETIGEALATFESLKKPVPWEEFAKAFAARPFGKERANPARPDGTWNEEVLASYVGVTKRIAQNPFGEWGLASWSAIKPRRMNEKIVLVLARAKHPMHFTEIAHAINAVKFDAKVAHPATVHNELIMDNRYVLVGRGMYGLSEWGLRPGVVTDVITAILNEHGRPMARDEIIGRVLKERMVKEATVALALTNRERFMRLPTGEYTLVAAKSEILNPKFETNPNDSNPKS